jgi:integrase
MANLKTTLMRICKMPDGKWQRFPAAFTSKGVIIPYAVLRGGKQEVYRTGRYQVLHYQGSQKIYTAASDNPVDAAKELKQMVQEVAFRAQARDMGYELPVVERKEELLSEQKDTYINRLLGQGKNSTATGARTAIDNFLTFAKVARASEVKPEHVTDKFYPGLRKIGNDDRTIYNKHVLLMRFLKSVQVPADVLAIKAPSFTESEVAFYEPEQLASLLNGCVDLKGRPDPYQIITVQTFKMTGMREQEAMYLEWRNVNFTAKTIKVAKNKAVGFKIKDRAERTIPLADPLAEALLAWRLVRPESKLVLGTRYDKPNVSLLKMLKNIARRAGLNCGVCESCMERNECEIYKLKTFRSTFATSLLRSGMDVRSVMAIMGHSDLETMQKYLAAMRIEPSQKLMSVIWT